MNPIDHPTPGARRGKLAVGMAVVLGLAASVGLQLLHPDEPRPAAEKHSCTESGPRAS